MTSTPTLRHDSVFVETPGLRIHALVAGADRPRSPVVMVHGFPQTSRCFRHQLTALSLAGHPVYAMDTRGFGRTEKPGTRVSRALLANDVVRFCTQLGLTDVAVVGHDWGGPIAFKAAIDHPGLFTRLALLDSNTTVITPAITHPYWFKAQPLSEAFLASHARDLVEVRLGGRDSTVSDKREDKYIDPRSSSKTFRQQAENWLKAQSPDPATREILRSRLESQIYPVFGHLTFGRIKPSTIRDWLGVMEEKRLAANYLVVFTVVTSVLDSAIDDKLIRENPCQAKTVRPPVGDSPQVVVWPEERVRNVPAGLPTGSGSSFRWAPGWGCGRARSWGSRRTTSTGPRLSSGCSGRSRPSRA
jgi:pimeloyl-ACP methyl ester carboxylesterase